MARRESSLRRGQSLMKSHEEFLKDVETKFGVNHHYKFLSEYDGMDHDIKVECTECGHIWKQKVYNFLHPRNKNNEACSVCNKRIKNQNREIERNLKSISTVNLTGEINQLNKQLELNKSFKEVLSSMHGDEYSLIGDYIDRNTPIKIKHNKNCNYEYLVIPNDFLTEDNCKCPKCRIDEITLNTFEKVKKFYEIGEIEYSIICEFDGVGSTIKLKHSKCGDILDVSLEDFIDGKRCNNPKCSKRANKHNFKDLVYEKYGNEFIVLSEYVDSSTEVKIKHNVDHCGKEYYRVPKHFLYGKGLCPYCKKRSNTEKEIFNILNENNIKCEREYTLPECKDSNLLRFDFVLFDNLMNIICLIEYDGQQHFEPVDFAGRGIEWAKEEFERIKIRDQIKNQYCSDNSINLYRIPYWHKDNIVEILDKIIHNEPVEVDEKFIIFGF